MSKYATEADMLRDKCAWLEARLRQYGRHETTCASNLFTPKRCNCGWDEAKRALPSAERKP